MLSFFLSEQGTVWSSSFTWQQLISWQQ